MKVEVKESKPDYPKLMRSTKNYDTILLAIKELDEENLEGIILSSTYWGDFEHSKEWKKKCFIPFTGTITLSND